MATREITPRSKPAQGIQVVPAIPNYTRPMAVVTTLFFMWGFITCLNDILVPHLKSLFDLSYAKVMLVQFAFFSAYFFFSWPWSKVVNRIGYQKTMVAGLLTMAVGAFLFLPAASIVSYPLFLTALIILGGGITGLQVAANPYVVAIRQTENGIQPHGPDAGVQLARHDDRAEARRAADSERRAAGHRTTPEAHARSAATLSRATSGLGQDALHRDRHCAIVIGGFDRFLEAAKPQPRREQPWTEDRGFHLEASQSDLRGDRDFRLCGRGSVHRELSGELFRLARDCGSLRDNCGGLCFVLLGWRHDRTLYRLGTRTADESETTADAMRDRGSGASHCFHVAGRTYSDVDNSRPSGLSTRSCSPRSSPWEKRNSGR